MGRIEERLRLMISHEIRRYFGNIKGIFIVIDAEETEKTAFAEMKDALKESIDSLEEAIRNMENELRDKQGTNS